MSQSHADLAALDSWFIEDNWLESPGGCSFDAANNSSMDIFNFNKACSTTLILAPITGVADIKSEASKQRS